MSSNSSIPDPSILQTLIYALSQWVALFWTFHLSGIIQYVAFVSGFFLLAYVQGPSVLWRASIRHSFQG